MAAGSATPGSTTDTGGHGQALVRSGSEDLPTGTVITSSGRVSAAEEYVEPSRDDHPFTPVQLARLDEALTLTSRETGLRFQISVDGREVADTVARKRAAWSAAPTAMTVPGSTPAATMSPSSAESSSVTSGIRPSPRPAAAR